MYVGMSHQWAKDIQEKLKQSKQYLKADYKLHISSESRCADHCTTYALSSTEKQFQKECKHTHDTECDRCQTLHSSLADLEEALESKNVHLRYVINRSVIRFFNFCCVIILLYFNSKDQHEELLHDVQAAIGKVQAWKAHVLRTAHQDAAKSSVIDELKSNQALVIIDWAMKFIPLSFRESQSEWFGKKGRPWHISAVITKRKDGELEV